MVIINILSTTGTHSFVRHTHLSEYCERFLHSHGTLVTVDQVLSLVTEDKQHVEDLVQTVVATGGSLIFHTRVGGEGN